MLFDVSLVSDDVKCLTTMVQDLFGPILPTLWGELFGDCSKPSFETVLDVLVESVDCGTLPWSCSLDSVSIEVYIFYHSDVFLAENLVVQFVLLFHDNFFADSHNKQLNSFVAGQNCLLRLL